ncbi:hypothetical protein [Devosia sp. 2618]|uniref:hypothetical protein n=1 Tax=Devosia sp. 2618 TaxID=3156454 RepID=UPI0033928E96
MEAMRQSRFVMMLTESEDQAIQNFRFANRIGTKAGAARTLIERGLAANHENEKSPAEAATSPSHGSNDPR